MADVLTRNINMAISKLPETSFNTHYTTASDFQAAVSQSLQVVLPSIEKIFNQNLVGSGSEFPQSFVNDWAASPSITLSDRLNADQFAILAARCLGGTITDSVLTASKSYKHVIKMQTTSANIQLKSSTVAIKGGAIDLFLAGMVVNSLSVEFQQGQQATYSAQLVGSGKFAVPSSFTYPTTIGGNYMGVQAASTLTLNDGSSFNLAGRVRSVQLGINNNCITDDRRLGDSLITSGDPTGGAYTGRVTRGDRTCTLTVDVFADDTTAREWAANINGTVINDFTYTAKGGLISDSTDRYQVKIIFPKSVISVVNLNDINPKLGWQLQFTPLLKSGEPGLVQIEIQDGNATLDS